MDRFFAIKLLLSEQYMKFHQVWLSLPYSVFQQGHPWLRISRAQSPKQCKNKRSVLEETIPDHCGGMVGMTNEGNRERDERKGVNG